MAFSGLLVTEIFKSIQGEAFDVGLPYTFVRLTGCNLRCVYCDSSYSFKGGKRYELDQLVDEVRSLGCRDVLLTGGEPLMQRNAIRFAKRLKEEGYTVSVETHGEASIREISALARVVMDIKTPGSGMCREGFRENLSYLKPSDDLKFVIVNESDLDWAEKEMCKLDRSPKHTFLSAANQAPNMPGEFESVSPTWLAEEILRRKLPARLQTQLHKTLWGDKKGV